VRNSIFGALMSKTELDRATRATFTCLGGLTPFDLRFAYIRQFFIEYGEKRAQILFTHLRLDVLQRESLSWIKERLDLFRLGFCEDSDNGKLVRLAGWTIYHFPDQQTLELSGRQ